MKKKKKKKNELILWVCRLRDLTLLEFFLVHFTMLKMGKEKQMIGEFFCTIFFSQEVAIGFCVGFLFFIYIEGGVVFFFFF